MNRLSLFALAAATAMTSAPALAQSGYQQQQQAYQQRQEDYQQAVRQNEQEHRDYRHARRAWERGQMLPTSYRSSHYMVSDYRTHGWNRPPRGYAYYNTDNGVVMAAIATGVISSIVIDANDHRGYDHR